MSENSSAVQLAERIGMIMSTLTGSADSALSPRPGRVIQVAPGEAVAWDDCCDGQLWARLVNLTPNEGSSPQRRQGADACAVPFFIATLELGIIRCAAVVNDQGVAPSAMQITADGMQGLADMAQLLAVLRCSPYEIRQLGNWTPRGPEGGCHGGFWTFTIRLDNCVECPEPETEP